MAITNHTSRCQRAAYRKRSGFTILEVMLAAFISTVLAATLMGLMISAAREQRLGLAQEQVFDYADRLQDRITNLLRGAGRQWGVALGDAAGAFYHVIIFRVPDANGNPRAASLSFDPSTHNLMYNPNALGGGVGVPILKSGDIAKLDDVRFSTGMAPGNVPDSSVVLVIVHISDHGLGRAGQINPNDHARWVSANRTFSVNLRRP